MNEIRETPSVQEAPIPRFRWLNIFLVILAVAAIIFGFARMSGGERGVWGATHRTHHPHR